MSPGIKTLDSQNQIRMPHLVRGGITVRLSRHMALLFIAISTLGFNCEKKKPIRIPYFFLINGLPIFHWLGFNLVFVFQDFL
jgi:hypothetical protein